MFSCSTPTLSYLIPPLYSLSFFLFCCVALGFSTIFTRAPLPLVLAEAAAAAVFALASLPLVLAEAAVATVVALALPPLVLADAAAATVFALSPLPLVLAEAAAVTRAFRLDDAATVRLARLAL